MLRASPALILVLLVPAFAGAQPPGAHTSRAVPNPAEQALRTGEAFLRAGDRGSAVGWFRQALQRAPYDPRPYLRLGETYLQRNDLPEARRVLEAGLARRPESVGLWLLLARVHRRRGELDRAAAALRELSRRAPDHLRALRLRAVVARERGAWSEALSVTRRLAREGAALGLSEQDIEQARRMEPALALLARPSDPVGAPRACEGSAVRRVLAGCAD